MRWFVKLLIILAVLGFVNLVGKLLFDYWMSRLLHPFLVNLLLLVGARDEVERDMLVKHDAE